MIEDILDENLNHGNDEIRKIDKLIGIFALTGRCPDKCYLYIIVTAIDGYDR